jgi:hypothetical protein
LQIKKIKKNSSKEIIMLPKKSILMMLVVFATSTIVFAETDAEKDRVTYLTARTIVYVYNSVPSGQFGHAHTARFSAHSSGHPLDVNRYYPHNNQQVSLVGPTAKDKSGTTLLTEFSRNLGIKSHVVYTFTETVNLEGIGPVLQLKQEVRGTTFGSKMRFGVAAPEVGIENQWVDEENHTWYTIVIPHVDKTTQKLLGTYVIAFRSYNRTIDMDKQGNTGDQVLIATGIGAAIGFGLGAAAAGRDTERVGKIGRAVFSSDVEERNLGISEGVGRALIVAGTTLAFATLPKLISKIPSIYPNIIYKITYVEAE